MFEATSGRRGAITLLVLLAPGLWAQPEAEAAKSALKEFAPYYANENEHVRRAAVEELGSTDHLLVCRQLLTCLDDKAQAVVDAAIVGLGQQRSSLAVNEIIASLQKARSPDRKVQLLRVLALSRPPQAFAFLLDTLDHKAPEIRISAVEVLAGYSDRKAEVLGALLPLAKDKDDLVRLSVMDALGALENIQGHPTALEGLADSDWRVRASAIRVCRKFRLKSSIQPLIDVLKSEDGRLQDDVTDALQDICDQDIDGDPERWQKWWDRVSERFEVPTLEEVADRRRKAVAARAGYAPPKTSEYPPYHGIKTRSRRLLFVLDVSNSMADSIVLDSSNAEQVRAFEEQHGTSRIKIDIAREELIRMVAGLKPHAYFNIILFDSLVHPWEKGLVPANGGNRNKAIKFLSRLTTDSLLASSRGGVIRGETNTFEALNTAFGIIKGDEANKRGFKTDADTMFLLSDGLPSTGRIVAPQPLLDYVRVVNRKAKMVIHTIGFGVSNRPLMQGLADQSGGQFALVGGGS